MRRDGPVAWIALFVALAALAFAMASYRRAGAGNTAAQVAPTRDAEDRLTTVPLTAAEMRRRLSDLAEDLKDQTEEGRRAARAELRELRQQAEGTLHEAKGEAKDAWRDLKPDLDKLDRQLKQQAKDAGDTIRSMLKKLDRRLRKPEPKPTPIPPDSEDEAEPIVAPGFPRAPTVTPVAPQMISSLQEGEPQ